MLKQDAVDLFGGRAVHLAAALEVSGAAISRWPDELTVEQADRVIGAALRLGILPEADLKAALERIEAARLARQKRLLAP
jgi:hypothetical protein